jgi:hypothetical protein
MDALEEPIYVQLYRIVPTAGTTLPVTGDITNVTPLHTVVDNALIAGIGFTVTFTTNVDPTHEPKPTGPCGTTLYEATIAAFVPCDNVPDIETAFVAPNKPLTLTPTTTGADQLYVVLTGTIPLVTFVGDTSNGLPEHLTRLIGLVTDGVGFTYTVAENAAPEHSNPPLLYIGVTL